MMEALQIFLHRIDANPWNPRMDESPEHIKQIALSIAKNGLLQVPVGRWVFPDGTPVHGMGTADLTESGMRVQLAFGHSRLAAFKWLEAVKDSSNLVGDWSRMPVMLVEMSNEDMALRALAENMARKDLNSIEEARAMMRFREEFQKTSAEIGAIFGLSDSAVRNKMRLLTLPEFLQDALRRGELTEGAGRALIPLYDIAEAARLEAEDGDGLKPSEILEAARSGLAPARVAEMVTALAELLGTRPAQLSILEVPRLNSEENPVASVSVETVEDNDDESADNDTLAGAGESLESDAGLEDEENADEEEERVSEPATPMERVIAAVKPAPAPIPAARPAPAPVAPKVEPKAVAKPEPMPEPKPTPTPAPVQEAPKPVATPAPAVTWEASQILLSLTLWPEDSHGKRMVSIGGRVNQGSPRMLMASLADVELPWQLVEMLEQLKGGLA
jgi:ParB/RepB/Spo0J family partition protein